MDMKTILLIIVIVILLIIAMYYFYYIKNQNEDTKTERPNLPRNKPIVEIFEEFSKKYKNNYFIDDIRCFGQRPKNNYLKSK